MSLERELHIHTLTAVEQERKRSKLRLVSFIKDHRDYRRMDSWLLQSNVRGMSLYDTFFLQVTYNPASNILWIIKLRDLL
jgi:hypothetical protein